MFWGTEQNSALGGGKDQELDQDKMMVWNLISSIPNRLQTVIDLKSRQINKEDFKSLVIYDLLCRTFMDSVLKALLWICLRWLFLQNTYLYPQILISSWGITKLKNMNGIYFL